jgi:solute carrier family 13 (sodium-dependent dicarboxylate transporter), member 2/3/5
VKLANLIALIAGPAAFFFVLFFTDLTPGHPGATRMAAITVWVATWWLTEATDLAVTALLPFLLMPLLGIADSQTVAAQYMDQTIFLFIGGVLLAFAIERWNLHQRIALSILSKLGTNPATMLAGVMGATFFISMWVSNTATTMMMLSAVLAIIIQMEKHNITILQKNAIAKALLLGLAYAASIGGMATLVGTASNIAFYKIYLDAYKDANDMNFFYWFRVAFPIAILLLIAAFFILKYLFLRHTKQVLFDRNYFITALRKLGRMAVEEKIVFVVFITTAYLWFGRKDIDFGAFQLTGWSHLLGANAAYVTDSTVAIAMAFLLFLIPSKNEKGKMLMSWEEAKKLPIGIILLLGSGFALSKGCEQSGLSTWLAHELVFLEHASPIVIIGGICIIVCVISELASNVASIQLVLPILIAIQKVTHLPALMLMVPATLAASLGFMLPVATPPNTIVFASGRIRAGDMRNAGSLLDIAGILIITVVSMMIRVMVWE